MWMPGQAPAGASDGGGGEGGRSGPSGGQRQEMDLYCAIPVSGSPWGLPQSAWARLNASGQAPMPHCQLLRIRSRTCISSSHVGERPPLRGDGSEPAGCSLLALLDDEHRPPVAMQAEEVAAAAEEVAALAGGASRPHGSPPAAPSMPLSLCGRFW